MLEKGRRATADAFPFALLSFIQAVVPEIDTLRRVMPYLKFGDKYVRGY